MQTANSNFELVKNAGRKNELVLLASGNRYLLSLLKLECRKHANSKDSFAIRPQLVHIMRSKTNKKGKNNGQEIS